MKNVIVLMFVLGFSSLAAASAANVEVSKSITCTTDRWGTTICW